MSIAVSDEIRQKHGEDLCHHVHVKRGQCVLPPNHAGPHKYKGDLPK